MSHEVPQQLSDYYYYYWYNNHDYESMAIMTDSQTLMMFCLFCACPFILGYQSNLQILINLGTKYHYVGVRKGETEVA